MATEKMIDLKKISIFFSLLILKKFFVDLKMPIFVRTTHFNPFSHFIISPKTEERKWSTNKQTRKKRFNKPRRNRRTNRSILRSKSTTIPPWPRIGRRNHFLSGARAMSKSAMRANSKTRHTRARTKHQVSSRFPMRMHGTLVYAFSHRERTRGKRGRTRKRDGQKTLSFCGTHFSCVRTIRRETRLPRERRGEER